MSIDFLRQPAPTLLDTPVEEVAEALRGVALDEPTADAVDYVFRHQVVRLLQRRAGREALEPWVEVIRSASATARRALAGSDTPWAARWRAFAAILESRLAAMDAQDPVAVLGRAHVAEVLRTVRGRPGIPQHVLGDLLGLQKANLTRVLNLAEANELIERRTLGRENQLFVGPNAPPEHAAAEPAHATGAAESRTGNPSRRPLDASGAGRAPASITGLGPAHSAGAQPASGCASAGSVRDSRSGSERAGERRFARIWEGPAPRVGLPA